MTDDQLKVLENIHAKFQRDGAVHRMDALMVLRMVPAILVEIRRLRNLNP